MEYNDVSYAMKTLAKGLAKWNVLQKHFKSNGSIIILSKWNLSLAGHTCPFTRVEVTQPESCPNSIDLVDAIRGIRKEKL